MPRGIYAREAKPVDDKPDVLELSVKLASGHFDTTLRVPFLVGESKETMQRTVDRWLAMIATCLQQGVEEMSLSFALDPADSATPEEGKK